MADAQYREMMQTDEWTSVEFDSPGNFLNKEEKITPCGRCGIFHVGPCELRHWKTIVPKDNESKKKLVGTRTWF